LNTVEKDTFIEVLIKERLKRVFGQGFDWVLVDYFDSGKGKRLGKCECGRTLRRQYTVQHVITGERKDLGIVHLKEHMDITDAEVNQIKTGVNSTLKEIEEMKKPPENDDTQLEINEFVHFADTQELLSMNRWLLQLQLGFNLSKRQQKELSVILKELNQRKNEADRLRDEEERLKNIEAWKNAQEAKRKKRTELIKPPIESDLPPQIEDYIINSLAQIDRVSISELWQEIMTHFKDIINDRAKFAYYTYLEALVDESENIVFEYEGRLKRYLLYQET